VLAGIRHRPDPPHEPHVELLYTMTLDTSQPADTAGVYACFHCGLPLPRQSYPAVVDGETRATCCPGCQAVAQLIDTQGLAAYYRRRSTPASVGGGDGEFEVYDLPELQGTFVRETGSGREASLLLEGLTCAACVWLIENRLLQIDGVQEVSINHATRRARVRWDPQRIGPSVILRAVAQIGYSAHPYDRERAETALKRERRAMLWRLFVAGFAMMQVMMYAVPVYIADGAMTPDIEQLMRLASFVLTAPVALWAALPFYRGAWRDFGNRRLGMDVPVAVGIIVAFSASVHSTWQGAGEVYFDSVTMFVFLLLGARYLEMNARAQAADAQERLIGLVPAVAERLDRFPDPGSSIKVAAATLRPGEHVLVRAGAAIPADGVVVRGTSAADESLLTGESRPVPKAPGARVTGGAVNLQDAITVRVEHVGENTVLAGIVRLMDRAQAAKPRIALFADHVARWFVAGLLVFTVVAVAAWWTIDPTRAVWVGIAILVVTCPCALSLATPAALTAATGALYRAGVLVTRGHALETLARTTHFVFDKTGTLTNGRLSLIGVLPLAAAGRDDCLRMASALELHSEHAIARAIAAACPASEGIAVHEARNTPGRGLEAMVDGHRLRIGTPEFVAELHGKALPPELVFVDDAVIVVALGDESGWLALFTLGDTLRRDARRVISELKALGKSVSLLTGDRPAAAAHVARELGIEHVRSGATPADKLRYVRELQQAGAVVAMAGDGINDAPVLAQAQVSIVLASGTDLAQANADLVLMSERLEPLLTAVAVARHTLRVIRQNLAWAAAYNVVALPLAVTGQVTPLVAALGMSLSSLLVVLNALRLVRGGDGAPAASTPAVADRPALARI